MQKEKKLIELLKTPSQRIDQIEQSQLQMEKLIKVIGIIISLINNDASKFKEFLQELRKSEQKDIDLAQELGK